MCRCTQEPHCPADYRGGCVEILDGLSHDSDTAAEEHKAPEYLAINPRGQLPSLVDGDIVVCESLAALLYLDEAYPEHPLLPSERKERALVSLNADLQHVSIVCILNFQGVQHYCDWYLGLSGPWNTWHAQNSHHDSRAEIRKVAARVVTCKALQGSHPAAMPCVHAGVPAQRRNFQFARQGIASSSPKGTALLFRPLPYPRPSCFTSSPRLPEPPCPVDVL